VAPAPADAGAFVAAVDKYTAQARAAEAGEKKPEAAKPK
jgi:hypothetical protein